MAPMREHQTKAEANAEHQMAAIRTLIRAGMKMIAKNDQLIRELAKAQRVTETKLQSLLDSLRRQRQSSQEIIITSSLDYSHRPQAGDLMRQAGAVDHFDHFIDILVGVR